MLPNYLNRPPPSSQKNPSSQTLDSETFTKGSIFVVIVVTSNEERIVYSFRAK